MSGREGNWVRNVYKPGEDVGTVYNWGLVDGSHTSLSVSLRRRGPGDILFETLDYERITHVAEDDDTTQEDDGIDIHSNPQELSAYLKGLGIKSRPQFRVAWWKVWGAEAYRAATSPAE